MKKKSYYEGNFRPGMAYVQWKMAGFPEGKLMRRVYSNKTTLSKCLICKMPWYKPTGRLSRICTGCQDDFVKRRTV